MKIRTTYALILAIYLIFSSSLAFAQKKGIVEGHLQDLGSGEALAFGSVFLAGTTLGVVTDDKGFYRLNQVPAGNYKLTAKYVGYTDTTISIEVKSGATTVQDVGLFVGAKSVATVIVTAQAFGQIKAINTQINAPIIKNVVSDQKIKELPDANAAEALARLPGVSIIREGGEAVAVTIRGVQQNTMYVNGMRLDGNLGGIASSMIGGIELSKAFLPDQDADILGGMVEFKIRDAIPGFRKEIWLRTGYNGFTKSFKMQDASLQLSNRFFDNKLGICANFSYDRKDRGTDVLSASYQSVGRWKTGSEDIKAIKLYDVTLNHTLRMNNRYGLTLYADYKLKTGKIFYQGFFSDLESDNRIASNDYAGSSNELIYLAQSYKSSERNIMNGIGGEHTLGWIKIDWNANRSQRENLTPQNINYNATNISGMTNMNSVDTLTTITQFMAHGVHDIKNTALYDIRVYNEKDYWNETNGRLNIEVPFGVSNILTGFLKFGGKYRDISRGYSDNDRYGGYRFDSYEKLYLLGPKMAPDLNWTFIYNGNPCHETFSSSEQPQDFSMLGAKTYFFPDFGKVERVYHEMISVYGRESVTERSNYTNTEQYYAGYVMSQLNISKYITFIPGVRYEKNEYSTTAKKFFAGQGSSLSYPQGVMTDTTKGYYNAYWFPMVHLKIKPLEWFDIRLSYTQTVSRPSFSSMSPVYYQDLGLNVSAGNPFLKPQHNTNYDLYLSFYTGKIGLFTAGVFYKELTDQVMDYQVQMIDPSKYGFGPSYKNKYYTVPVNNKWPGYVRGTEFDWQTQFSWLPKPFNGIILNANITFMQSTTRYPFYAFTTKKIPKPPFSIAVGNDSSRVNKIIGMPDFVGNVSLGYELGGFSGRISFQYNGPTITQAQAIDKSVDVNKDQFLRLDVQLSQKIGKYITAFFNIENLTNNPDRQVHTYYTDHVVRDERYGTSGDIGIRFKF